MELSPQEPHSIGADGRPRYERKLRSQVTQPFKDSNLAFVEVNELHKHWSHFKEDIDIQLPKAFHDQSKTYTKVNVLLLWWEEYDHDQNNKAKMEDLGVYLSNELNFHVRTFEILGDAKSWRDIDKMKALWNALHEFNMLCDDESLSIIFYSGHSCSARGPGLYSPQCRRVKKELRIYPSAKKEETLLFDPNTTVFGLDYTTITDKLCFMGGSVLHILDACNGGGVALNSHRFEVLSASALEPSPLPPAKSPFIPALKASLSHLKKTMGSFTTVQLHAHLVSNATAFESPLLTLPFYSADLRKKDAIHIAPQPPNDGVPTEFPSTPPCLGRRPLGQARNDDEDSISTNCLTPSGDSSDTSEQEEVDSDEESDEQESGEEESGGIAAEVEEEAEVKGKEDKVKEETKANQTNEEERKEQGGNEIEAQVILSIHLSSPLPTIESTFIPHLLNKAHAPWLANVHHIASYPSLSGTGTVMLVRMPVSLWDLLPEDPAYVFVDFVGSRVVIPEEQVEGEEVAAAYESFW